MEDPKWYWRKTTKSRHIKLGWESLVQAGAFAAEIATGLRAILGTVDSIAGRVGERIIKSRIERRGLLYELPFW